MAIPPRTQDAPAALSAALSAALRPLRVRDDLGLGRGPLSRRAAPATEHRRAVRDGQGQNPACGVVSSPDHPPNRRPAVAGPNFPPAEMRSGRAAAQQDQGVSPRHVHRPSGSGSYQDRPPGP
jgi:hypothetical protein